MHVWMFTGSIIHIRRELIIMRPLSVVYIIFILVQFSLVSVSPQTKWYGFGLCQMLWECGKCARHVDCAATQVSNATRSKNCDECDVLTAHHWSSGLLQQRQHSILNCHRDLIETACFTCGKHCNFTSTEDSLRIKTNKIENNLCEVCFLYLETKRINQNPTTFNFNGSSFTGEFVTVTHSGLTNADFRGETYSQWLDAHSAMLIIIIVLLLVSMTTSLVCYFKQREFKSSVHFNQ